MKAKPVTKINIFITVHGTRAIKEVTADSFSYDKTVPTVI